MRIKIKILFIVLAISSITVIPLADRKKMVSITGKKIPGYSTYAVPNKKHSDGAELVDRKNIMKFDKEKGLYVLTYWRPDGEEVEVYYEPSNLVDLIVECAVRYDPATKEYQYKYTVHNLKSSKQSLNGFVVYIDSKFVLRTSETKGWFFFSRNSPEYAPRWSFWGSLGSDVKPDDNLSILIISKLGPTLSHCYAQGRAKTFPHPDSIDALCVPPPNIEGTKGLTLAPGKIDVDTDINSYLQNVLQDCLEWGWMDKNSYDKLFIEISGKTMLNKSDFSRILDMCKYYSTEGVIMPEVEALLTHIGKSYYSLE